MRERTTELKTALERAEFTAAAAIKFLSTASHDLRQPLQATALLVSSLAIELSDGRSRETIRAIENSLSAGLELLDALLDFRRLDARAVRPASGPVDLGAALARAADSFAAEAQVKGLARRLVLSCLSVKSNRNLIGRILRNVPSNAVEYTQRGTILVGCRRQGRRVILPIWDTGCGISETEIRRIFWEVSRVRSRGAGEGAEGFGLGLAILQRLANLLKHRLSVRSRLGRGSVFSIEMDLADAPAPTDAAVRLDGSGGSRGGSWR